MSCIGVATAACVLYIVSKLSRALYLGVKINYLSLTENLLHASADQYTRIHPTLLL